MGTEADVATPATDEASRLALLRARLAAPMPDDRLWGWLGPLLVTAFGAWLRFDRLQVPRALIFDETYYAKDAWSILQHGVEWNYVASPTNRTRQQLILAGHTTGLFQACTGTGCGEYVVQPPVGKLLIAVGEWLFGLNSLGWRFASAVFGSLAILVMCRVARRITRSTLLGCVAGLLLSLDGLEFVLSQDRHPGHLPDVLRAGRVRLRWSSTGTSPAPGWPRPSCSRAGDEAGPAARHQEVAGRRPAPLGLAVRDQAGRGLVHPRVRRAG